MDENPTVRIGETPAARKRIPLSVPQRKLEVAPIPGYYLRWFRGTPARLAQAERAGFEFVDEDEVQMNSTHLGGNALHTGSTDLGTRVSVIEGSETDGAGQAVRMYLMKQKLEYYHEDAKTIQARNDLVADALTTGYRQGQVGGQAPGETAADVNLRYVDPKRTKVPDLFRKKGSG
jgi:hypothetical protein